MKKISAYACSVFSVLGLVVLAGLILALNSSAAVLILGALSMPLFFVYPLMMAKSFHSEKTGDVLYINFEQMDTHHPFAA